MFAPRLTIRSEISENNELKKAEVTVYSIDSTNTKVLVRSVEAHEKGSEQKERHDQWEKQQAKGLLREVEHDMLMSMENICEMQNRFAGVFAVQQFIPGITQAAPEPITPVKKPIHPVAEVPHKAEVPTPKKKKETTKPKEEKKKPATQKYQKKKQQKPVAHYKRKEEPEVYTLSEERVDISLIHKMEEEERARRVREIYECKQEEIHTRQFTRKLTHELEEEERKRRVKEYDDAKEDEKIIRAFTRKFAKSMEDEEKARRIEEMRVCKQEEKNTRELTRKIANQMFERERQRIEYEIEKIKNQTQKLRNETRELVKQMEDSERERRIRENRLEDEQAKREREYNRSLAKDMEEKERIRRIKKQTPNTWKSPSIAEKKKSWNITNQKEESERQRREAEDKEREKQTHKVWKQLLQAHQEGEEQGTFVPPEETEKQKKKRELHQKLRDRIKSLKLQKELGPLQEDEHTKALKDDIRKAEVFALQHKDNEPHIQSVRKAAGPLK